jgi:hypothetical protein
VKKDTDATNLMNEFFAKKRSRSPDESKGLISGQQFENLLRDTTKEGIIAEHGTKKP